MLSLVQAIAFMLLLGEILSQPADQLLNDCQDKSKIEVTFEGTVISIECLERNIDVIENDIRCGYERYKAKHDNTHEFTEVKELSVHFCQIPSSLTYKKILEVLEVSERMIRNIKSVRLIGNKPPLNSKRLQGLESVTNFTIYDFENSVKIETLTVVPNLKKIEINCNRLENVSNETVFNQLEELTVTVKEYSPTDSANNNIVHDLMLLSDKFKMVKIHHDSSELPSIVIRKSLFGRNTGLERLIIHLPVNTIEIDAFKNFHNLQLLDLSWCQITNIDSDAFPSSLKSLDLLRNQLKNFIAGRHLTNLEELFLNNNQFETFDANSLPSSLKLLDLSHNPLKSFVGGRHLINLVNLRLSNNEFETFDATTLPSSVKVIDLSFNPLKNLTSWNHLTNLEEMNLEYNEIKIFDANQLPSSLKLLMLKDNRMTSFVGGTHLINLETLDLRYNSIETINTEMLPSTLKHLHLTLNILKEFVIEKHFNNLETLQLDGNKLVSFNLNFDYLPKVQTLDLGANHMKQLDVFGSFPPSLTKLNLGRNEFQSLDTWYWIYQHKGIILYSDAYTLCDCGLQNNSIEYKDFNEWLTCQLPIPAKFEIKISELNCPTQKTDDCITYQFNHTDPYAYIDKFLGLQMTINCSNTNWPLKNGFPMIPTDSRLNDIHLYLNGNKDVHFLPSVSELPYKNLYIYVENCSITHPFSVTNLAQIRSLKRLVAHTLVNTWK